VSGVYDGSQEPEHWLGLHGASVIETEAFRLVRRTVADVQARLAMGAAHGDAGVGKTFGVAHALRACATLPVVRVEMPERATQRFVAFTLLKALGVPVEGGNGFELTEQLLDELRDPPRLLVVDEAQRLYRGLIEYLRLLHDDPNTQFALLFVGGNGCWNVLAREPMLRSRIHRRCTFPPLTAAEVLEAIPSYHPIYVGTDEDTLLLIDDAFAHGVLRDWANFTITAADICADNEIESVDDRVARNALTLLDGRKPQVDKSSRHAA
jgi:hypothetical protein